MSGLSLKTVLYLLIALLSVATAILGIGKFGPINYFPSPVFIIAFGGLFLFSYAGDRRRARDKSGVPSSPVRIIASLLWSAILLLFLGFVFSVFLTVAV